MDRKRRLLYRTAAMALMVMGVTTLLGIDNYVAEVKKRAQMIPFLPVFQYQTRMISADLDNNLLPLTQPQLRERIQKEAVAKKIAPINAKLDRVWKAIPGYNGIEVDIEKTLHLAKQSVALDKIPFVYQEIPPHINLKDLEPNPIYKGNPHKPMVSLMINVAWGDEFIPSMIEVLNKENVHATFFLDGSWLQNHITTAQLIGKQGHELSNHAFSHKNMSQLSKEQVMLEISKTQHLLEQKLGVHNTLFAPPSGDFNEQTVKIAHEMKLQTILWTLDTVDWRNPKPEEIIRKIAANVEPGSLILMHPTLSSSLALEMMIKQIKKKALVLGTVSELLSTSRVLVPNEVQSGR